MSLAGRSIFLVEDQAILAMELDIELRDVGAEIVGPAYDLQQALDLAAQELSSIDAAILDVDLRGEDVYPVADILSEEGIPFIFHTGHGTQEELLDRYENALFCSKPALPDKLISLLAELCDKAGT